MPFVPVNYRLDDHQLNGVIARHHGALVLADEVTAPRLDSGPVIVFDDWLTSLPADAVPLDPPADDNDVAIVLFTKGSPCGPDGCAI